MPCEDPYQANAGASLSSSMRPAKSTISRSGIGTRGASGSDARLVQPSQMAAYPVVGVAV